MCVCVCVCVCVCLCGEGLGGAINQRTHLSVIMFFIFITSLINPVLAPVSTYKFSFLVTIHFSQK